jgi:hypothetical protein
VDVDVDEAVEDGGTVLVLMVTTVVGAGGAVDSGPKDETLQCKEALYTEPEHTIINLRCIDIEGVIR